MPIGSSVAVSIPALSTTTKTLNKTSDGVYRLASTPVMGYPGVFFDLELVPSKTGSKKVTFAAKLRYNPSVYEDPLHPNLGRFSASVSADFTPGTVVTTAIAIALTKELASVVCTDAIISALVAGSTE